MSYTMGIDYSKWGRAFYNCLAHQNNLHDNDYMNFFNCYPTEYIYFVMQQPAFSEHMLYTPAKEFNDAEESIYPVVKSSDW
jgi:hypothetical protein